MRILLDTHMLLWALTDDPKLPQKAREIIEQDENDIYYSMISLWEVELKHLLHPLQMTVNAEVVRKYCEEARLRQLAIHEKHIFTLRTLVRPDYVKPHKDPFDRLLICQAKCENMLFLTHDVLLQDYDEPCVSLV